MPAWRGEVLIVSNDGLVKICSLGQKEHVDKLGHCEGEERLQGFGHYDWVRWWLGSVMGM